MISHNATQLTEIQINEIRDWLISPRCDLVIKCVGQRIARLQSEAANAAIRAPWDFMMERELTPSARQSLIEAASWMVFIQKLREIRDHPDKFPTYLFYGQS